MERKCPLCGDRLRIGFVFGHGATANCECGFTLEIGGRRGEQINTAKCIKDIVTVLDRLEGQKEEVHMTIYDKEDIYHNCTVQVLTNTITGDISVGWWPEDDEENTQQQ